MSVFDALFGHGRDLDALQMAMRAAAVFALTLVVIRVSGRRSLGQRHPFDQVVMILLGAVVSRAVVGASPFVPTMVAAVVLVGLHRGLGWLGYRYPALDRLINGSERLLASHGRIDAGQMRQALVTERDLEESARVHNRPHWRGYDHVLLERDGRISLVGDPPAQ